MEVGDRSSHPPAVNVGMAYDENLLSTIGRGLGIVALYSSAWGAEVVPDGKTVWFEPSSEPRLEGDLTGDVFDLERSIAERLADTDTVDLVPVRLLGMPAVLFGQFRRRYSEMRRELRLLALAHGEDYPVASELTEVFLEVERERRLARGVDNLDAAIEQGLERVDLDYMVPLSAGETMARLQVLLERADVLPRAAPARARRLPAADGVPALVPRRVRPADRRGAAHALDRTHVGRPRTGRVVTPRHPLHLTVLLAVAVGGALGACARYGLTTWFEQGPASLDHVRGQRLGLFLLALLPGIPAVRRQPLLPPLLGTGVLGGYTTLSAWSEETRALVADGSAGLAALYVAGTLAACLAAVALADRWSTPDARHEFEDEEGDL